MRAIRIEDGVARVDTDVPEPVPGPGEAVVRVTRFALGGRDVSGRGGERVIPGSEFVGVVERVADGPRSDGNRWLGRRVVCSALIACGRCDRCRSGLSNHCVDRHELGRSGRDGCAAECVAVPVRNLVEVPRGLDDDVAVFAEPLSHAVHAAGMARVEGRTFVTVLGDGCLGLLCAQLMVRRNASVRLLGDRPGRLQLCEKWGIKHRHVDEAGRRQDQDLVFECSGIPRLASLATRFVRPRGTLVLAAWQGGESSGLDTGGVVENELTVLGCRGGRIAAGVEALASGVDVVSLIGRRFRLADGAAAVRAAGTPEAVRVIVEP